MVAEPNVSFLRFIPLVLHRARWRNNGNLVCLLGGASISWHSSSSSSNGCISWEWNGSRVNRETNGVHLVGTCGKSVMCEVWIAAAATTGNRWLGVWH